MNYSIAGYIRMPRGTLVVARKTWFESNRYSNNVIGNLQINHVIILGYVAEVPMVKAAHGSI